LIQREVTVLPSIFYGGIIVEFERKIFSKPAFDKWNRNSGIGSVVLIFAVIYKTETEQSAMELSVCTGWHLPSTQRGIEFKCKDDGLSEFNPFSPVAFGLSFHTDKKPENMVSYMECDRCMIIKGKCYSSTYLTEASDRLLNILITQNVEDLWKELETALINKLDQY